MKSQKGITLTSLIVYVTALSIVISVITVISTYFYKNVTTVSDKSNIYKQYTKFNSYFLQEVNTSNNSVVLCGENYINFSNGNTYTFKNESIYFNKIKICDNIKECSFTQYSENQKNKISVRIEVDETDFFETEYSLKSW